MKTFDWRGLTLLPERAVWRAPSRTLFVADVHLGKAAAFRAAGLPAPAGTTRENLPRLAALIDAFAARRLVILGDLFHARAALAGGSLEALKEWRARRPGLALTLVTGNHDAAAGAAPAGLDIAEVAPPAPVDGVECRHYPLEAPGEDGPPLLAGHLHPAVRLGGPGRDSLRLPCFVMRGRQLILPAFGEFTGAALVSPDAETALCAVAEDRLVPLAAAAARRFRR